MLRRISSLAFVCALLAAGVPVSAAVKTRQAEGTGRISGTAKDAKGVNLANHTARLRNISTGQIAGETTTNASGQWSFAGLNPGQYVVEIVNPAGLVVATTTPISLTVGAMVAAGVSITASAAAAGTAGAVAAAAAAGGGFFGSTAGAVLLAAVGAGIGTTVAVVQTASPSR